MTRIYFLYLSWFFFSCTSAERYTFDISGKSAALRTIPSSDVKHSFSTRTLQSTNEEPCYLDADKVVCIYSFAAGSVKNETSIVFMARCDINPLYGFDYRRLSNCACLAQVTPINGEMKECPCSVCGVDLGETPVSVDCSVHETTTPATITNETDSTTATSRASNTTEESGASGSVTIDDSVSIPGNETETPSVNTNVTESNETMVDPFIFATCTSIDCFGACNGTCSLNCNDPSGNVCPYCESYSGPGAPTASPTGSGNDEIVDLGKETSNAAAELVHTITIVTSLVTAGYFVFLS